MTDQTKTPDQLAAEAAQAAADAAAKKAREKAEAAAKKKADAEAAKAKAAADRKAKADAKVAEKAAAKKKREDDKAAKVKAAADKVAAKEAAKQPERNGIRRPNPDGKCGKAWALMDHMTTTKGAPVAIADLLIASGHSGMNPNMVRSNYAAWRKFNGVAGRVLSQAEIASAAAATAAAEAAKSATTGTAAS